MKKGSLITFEGGDGAGKSTLIDRLFETLSGRGLSLLKTRAPGGSKAGQIIRGLLLNQGEIPLSSRCELFLFLADRAQHVETIIQPALQEGKIVLCDRYNDSTIAYQGVGRAFGIEKIKELCDFATQNLKTDLTLYLDLDPQLGMQRVQRQGGKDRIEAEDLSFHEKIRQAFLNLAKAEPKRIQVLDATQPKEAVFHQALRTIDALLTR